MSPEFLKKSGGPEDPELVRASELAFRRQAEVSKKENPEFEELLAGIDFDWMRGAFKDIFVKFKINPDTMNFVGPDMIIADNGIKDLAQYRYMENLIRVNHKLIKENIGPSTNPVAVLAIIMLHEECHAISRNICTGYFDYDEDGSRVIKSKSGYLESVIVDEEGGGPVMEGESFVLFDEGVTEKMARELVIRYMEAHPDLEEKDKRKRIYEDDSKYKPYYLAVSLVEAMIAKISHETGISRETVWQAIIGGKIEGENLGDADFREMFSEIFTPQFIKDLRTAGVSGAQAGKTSVAQSRAISMIGSLDLGRIDPELLERIQKRIDVYMEASLSDK